ncbi:EamA-like transporter family protein [Octadecabacter temperatus]|uniref:EamA-like transporter family protein n=1 Tax=Octadecabacter temperatus TaxID=1458307 RepID=A0A0K0Y621_9RHOB|nr:DMT family transporter [Octadecabacter temperatus]AKS46375.1 EamA-like transporter family protein [Octadecabacter temperatus]SIO12817.1 EamA-like transporter family protein [Octadecabacter temperatus]
MQLFALIAVTMCAFAANSILARAGVFTFEMEPLLFAGVRLASGAAMLAVLVLMRGGWARVSRARVITASTLLLYLVPFSIAYLTLPSGVGALILFGIVQITMFGGSYLAGTQPNARQWVGMAVAMAGLGWLLWPTESMTLDVMGVVFMVVSGFGWGVFSMRGRGSQDPLGDMALSFALCAPVALVLMLIGTGWSLGGLICAVLSGAVMSGLGYALWYRVLPQVAATTSAVAQLSVPVIAIVAGAILLNETITLDVVVASAVVLGGIAVSVLKRA